MADSVQICLVQESFLVGNIQENARKIIDLSDQARQSGADLVVFPELAVTGYPPEDLLLRHSFITQNDLAVQDIVSSVKGIDIVFGAPRRINSNLFNSAIWARDGEILGVYDKYTLPNYAVFDEKRYFTAGDTPIVINIKGIRFGLSICEDIWLDQPVQDAKQQGAQAMLVLNASPYHSGKYIERLDNLKLRNSETGLALFYVNLVGGQDELVFDGESLVLDANAELVGRGPDFEPALLHYRLNSDGMIESVNTDFHQPQSEESNIYKALVTAVRDYVTNNGFDGVVIGLSGGVDSALTLAIAVDALGADQIHAVMMPSRYTAQMSLDDAQAEAEILGVDYRVISIEPAFNTFLDTLETSFKNTESDTTEENIQARCRGVILMALSNKLGRMLLTTGNKSEMAVGYSTLYGDMAGGFAPLKDVYKTLVYRLCEYRNNVSPVIPQRVLDRPPSAELKPDQIDQDSLPDYAVLDAILELSVERDKSSEEIIAAGFDAETVHRIIRMVQLNEYKRRQAPPGVRITRRAFGRDRRYPITSGYR
ncbi:MAG: NAD+ synthase [Gammaproteobacteria bacterium]|nr:NAD+ synthase [Gammaproteobacteria bacterium]MCW9003625.1 NAD+ synthase [Gammaproteobacteria bacterium]